MLFFSFLDFYVIRVIFIGQHFYIPYLSFFVVMHATAITVAQMIIVWIIAVILFSPFVLPIIWYNSLRTIVFRS